MPKVHSQPEPVEAWRRAFRDGVCSQLSTKGLEALRVALEKDDPHVITGRTVEPPPLHCNENEPVEACCPMSYGLLDGGRPGEWTVGQIEERFAMTCYRGGQLLGEANGLKHFLAWVDDTPRVQMRAQLLLEVVLELALRLRGKQSRVCPSCGSINVTGELPAADDTNGWRRLALDHERACLWIKTRGGQYTPPNEWYYEPTPLAKLLQASIDDVKAQQQDPRPAA